MIMKRIFALVCILALCLGLLIYSMTCADSHLPAEPVGSLSTPDEATADEPLTEPATADEATPDTPTAPEEKLRLSFLNDQPVLQMIYDQLSDTFFGLSGIRVETVSSAANLGDKTPVLLSVSSLEELAEQPCLDLKNTVAYANLACDCFTLVREEQVVGIASEAEPFGIICSSALLARAAHTASDITSFGDLKAVTEYITNNRDTLGFGAFAAEDKYGRVQSLLSVIPGDVRPLADLYRSNRVPGDVYNGNAVFCFGTLSDMEQMSIGGLQLEMLPLYIGSPEEQNQGLHCFGKRYWCIRSDASQEEIDGALAFLNFLVSPQADGTVPVDDLCGIAPYRQAAYSKNAVAQRFRSDIATGKNCVVCGAEPPYPEAFGIALDNYFSDPTDEAWAAVQQLRNIQGNL